MLFINPALLVMILSGVACLALLGVLLRRQFARRDARSADQSPQPVALLLLILSLLLGLGWIIAQAAELAQAVKWIHGLDAFALARMALYFFLSGAFVFALTMRVFLRKDGSSLTIWVLGAAFLAVVISLYETVGRLPTPLFLIAGVFITGWQLAFGLIAAGWALIMLYTLLLTYHSFLQANIPLHRNRLIYGWLALGFLLASGTAYLLLAKGAADILFLCGIGCLSYVFLTHDLPDVRAALRQSAAYIIMLLIDVSFYTGAYFLAYSYSRSANLPPGARLLPVLVLAGVLVVILNPFLRMLRRTIDHMLNGARYDERQTLADYSQKISNILEMDVLAGVVVQTISEAMDITHGALLTVHAAEEAYHLRVVPGGNLPLPEGILAANSPAAYTLSHIHHPLTQYDIDLQPRHRALKPEERAWWNSLNMDVYVPIYANDAWIGLLALGRKVSGDRYNGHDLALLQTLADQSAVALENARLVVDLKTRIAENERLNEELTSANVELERLDRAKSDFISIASHELRTPLTQVLGFNDILNEMVRSDHLDHETAVQMAEGVRRAARRLEEIVETMFDVSKLDTHTLDLACGPVVLANVITAAADNWSAGMSERNISLTMRGVTGLPVISADAKRLQQAFSQLIQNAIKSTPDGGQITITGQSAVDMQKIVPAAPHSSTYLPSLFEQAFVEIQIADTGIGIDPPDLERIFQKFYRVGSALLHSTGDVKFKGAGPGLGLTIARGIIEAHGGRIWAESPGHNEKTLPGAVFHVLLPVDGGSSSA